MIGNRTDGSGFRSPNLRIVASATIRLFSSSVASPPELPGTTADCSESTSEGDEGPAKGEKPVDVNTWGGFEEKGVVDPLTPPGAALLGAFTGLDDDWEACCRDDVDDGPAVIAAGTVGKDR